MSLTLQPGVSLKSPQRTYIIEEVLGQGGFGITYLAKTQVEVTSHIDGPFGSQEQTQVLSIQVALKEFFMKDVNGRNGTQVTTSQTNGVFKKYYSKFATEADNLKNISHPNIVKVLEHFEANGTQYYSMELIDGGTLDEYIANRGGLPVDESVQLIKIIAQALDFMHSKKMLHLDLKPKNIMMRKDRTPVIIDFGLSKQYDDNGEPESSTTIGAGTPGFAPIEQTSYHGGKEFPTTLDVYALGATLYKMLTSLTPEPADEVLNNGLNTEPLKRKGVDDELINLIIEAMHPMRKQRIQTVNDFLSLLPSIDEDEIVTVIMEEKPVADETMIRGEDNQAVELDSENPTLEAQQEESNSAEEDQSEDHKPKGLEKRTFWTLIGFLIILIIWLIFTFWLNGQKGW